MIVDTTPLLLDRPQLDLLESSPTTSAQVQPPPSSVEGKQNDLRRQVESLQESILSCGLRLTALEEKSNYEDEFSMKRAR